MDGRWLTRDDFLKKEKICRSRRLEKMQKEEKKKTGFRE
jgi:hypothetical protein